jgi:hypothetical protein
MGGFAAWSLLYFAAPSWMVWSGVGVRLMPPVVTVY